MWHNVEMNTAGKENNAAGELMHDRSIIGIDLGATNVRVARIVAGEIEKLLSQKIRNTGHPEDLLDQISNLIELARASDTASIGIGVPSVVDVEKGIVYDVQNIPSWKEVHVKSIFEHQFEIPVFVNNDANCFVLGEKYFGKGKGCKSIVGLVMGSGFGGGLVLDGRLYSGPNCGAGEVGMLPYRDTIFEHYCSGMFFDREYNISGDKAYRQALKGKEKALRMYEAFGTHLGNALKAVLYAFDPEMIVLGGSISSAFSLFEHSMNETMKDFAYPNSLSSLKIEISELDHVAVLGAAALALDMKHI